jgi:molybdate transport system substrate-binding protein
MRTAWVIASLALSAVSVTPGHAAMIDVMSAGAVEPGILAAAAEFKKETGTEVKVRFNTAPALRKKIMDGEKADLLIAPPAAIEDLVKEGKIKGDRRVTLGRVGAGVAVNKGAPVPKVATTDDLKAAVRDAQSIVFNRASTGLYLEKMFEKLGVGADVKAKEKRFATGEEVMEEVLKSSGKTIGFGAMTEIKEFTSKGLVFVGPLPADVQNYTTYAATPLVEERPELKAFLDYLGGKGKTVLAANGVE